MWNYRHNLPPWTLTLFADVFSLGNRTIRLSPGSVYFHHNTTSRRPTYRFVEGHSRAIFPIEGIICLFESDPRLAASFVFNKGIFLFRRNLHQISSLGKTRISCWMKCEVLRHDLVAGAVKIQPTCGAASGICNWNQNRNFKVTFRIEILRDFYTPIKS